MTKDKTYASISYEVWEAFAEERRHWQIVDVTGAYVITDRKRYHHGEEINALMEVEYTSEMYPTREAAAFAIGLHSVQTALAKTGIVHVEEK